MTAVACSLIAWLKRLSLGALLCLSSLGGFASPRCPELSSAANGQVAALFQGQNAGLHFAPWQPTEGFRLVVWLAQPAPGATITLLSDSTDNYRLTLTSEGLVSRWNGRVLTLPVQLRFDRLRYLEIEIEPGELRLHDGLKQYRQQHPGIQPAKSSWQRAFSHDTEAALQAMAMIDLDDIQNSRSYYFDTGCRLQEHGANLDTAPRGKGITSYLGPLAPPSPPTPPIATAAQWEQFHGYTARWRERQFQEGKGNDQSWLAWEGHYWMRAYITMARVSGDHRYLKEAVRLADYMVEYTDSKRQQRGELDLAGQPYKSAPKPILNRPSQAAPGWRGPNQGWHVEVLTDGQILNALTRLADHIKSQPELPYQQRADHYLALAREVIASHRGSFSQTKRHQVPGAFYFVNPTNPALNDSGLYANPLPYNHQMTMGTAMMLVHKWFPNEESELKQQVDQLITFFTQGVVFNGDGSCTWRYSWNPAKRSQWEDINHGHLDIGFLVLAKRLDYYLDERLLPCAARTLVQQVFIPPAMISLDLRGQGISDRWDQVALGYDWIDLAQYQPTLLPLTRHVLHHFGQPSWVRPLLAWANMLDIEQADSEAEHAGQTGPARTAEVTRTSAHQ